MKVLKPTVVKGERDREEEGKEDEYLLNFDSWLKRSDISYMRCQSRWLPPEGNKSPQYGKNVTVYNGYSPKTSLELIHFTHKHAVRRNNSNNSS